ncbi:TonB family protein [Halioxenophilus aromaticivorans]|uniref:TonB C-terminal domain-containing protein n=1 Tax=Halioxenophilus aromaticivorans TaxID=1306992 RepID=A0AAV3U0W4_9ALTE
MFEAEKTRTTRRNSAAAFGYLLAIITAGLISHSSTAAPLLNGVSSYEYLGKERFIAALFLDSPATEADAIFELQQHRQMEIRCTNNFSARRHVKTWIEGAAINNPTAVLKDYADAMVAFTQLINVPLKPGDRLLIDAPNDAPVAVLLNDVELGKIEPPGIFDVLLRAWIGSVPLSSAFRANLLAAGDVDQDLSNRFSQLRPIPERTAFAQTLAASIKDGALEREPSNTSQLTQAQPQSQEEPAPPTRRSTLASQLTPPATPVTTNSAPAIPAPAQQAPTQAQPQRATTTLPEPAPQPAQAPAQRLAATTEDEDDQTSAPITAQTLLQQQLYHSDLLGRVYREVKYPRRAIDRNYQGRVTLQVVIDQKGALKELQTLDESQYGILNRAAEKAVKEAAPFPAPPVDEPGEDYAFTVPVEFKLQ